MKKSAFWLGLVLLASMFAQGCCWYNRPVVFPRLHPFRCGDACSAGYCAPDCGCGVMAEPHFGTPLPTVPGPTMPGSAPLTRATFPQK